jgi:hypothetical protein
MGAEFSVTKIQLTRQTTHILTRIYRKEHVKYSNLEHRKSKEINEKLMIE